MKNEMTDEELVRQLRLPWFTNGCEMLQRKAADRIEALVKERDALRAERDAAKQIYLVSIAHGQDDEAEVEKLRGAATWAMNHVSKLPMDEATKSEFMRHRAALTAWENRNA